MVDLQMILIDGALLTAAFTVFVLGIMLWKPRLLLQDFPPDLQALIPPKTPQEKRLTNVMSVPLFAILLTALVWTGIRYGVAQGFGALVLHVYLVWQVMNIFDLLVIDGIGMFAVDPANPPYPGTENAKGYRDFGFHLRGYVKGSAMGIVIALVVAAGVWLTLISF